MVGGVNKTVETIISEMKCYFGEDTRRINHAMSVLEYAREIMAEEGGSQLVIESAAALHDIGIHEAERKFNSVAGNYQEVEGPAIAEGILNKFGVGRDDVNHISKIIANHHSAKDIDTLEFRIIWDSDWLVNIPDEFDVNDVEKMKELCDNVFKTNSGRRIATEIFC
jgi:HD superfamily phosphodiesterase